MAFHDVQFPTDISWGSSFGPGWNTSVIVSDSGYEQRISRWSQARRQYDVAESIKTDLELAALLTFFMGRQGAAHSFRFKDFTDYASSANHVTAGEAAIATTNVDQQIGVGDGVTLTFQLIKNYVSGPVTRVRTITKPVAGTVKVALNGVNQAAGWTIDNTTGIITFGIAPTAAVVVTAGYEFDVPCRFGDEIDGHLPISLDEYSSGSVKVPIIEVRDDVAGSDEFFYGGANEVAITSAYTLTGIVRVWVINSNGASVILPDPTLGTVPMTPGAPWFYIINDGATTFSVKDQFGTTMLSLLAGQACEAILSVDNLGMKVWYCF